MRSNHPRHVEIRLAVPADAAARREALEATEIHSVLGLTTSEHPLLVRRPFRSPHHTVSAMGMAGGGSSPRPGEISLAHNGVLFLDELHTLVGAGSAEGAIDAANILKPALGRGEIQIIGATTRDEYRRYICKDPALERRFQPVQVEPPTPEQALGILKALRPRYERHHGLLITDEALCEAVRLSERFLPDRYLPDKAIDLMDEAAARVRIRGRQEPPELRRMEEEHHAAETALRQAVEQEQFEQAAALRDQEQTLLNRWQREKRRWRCSSSGWSRRTSARYCLFGRAFRPVN